MFLLHTSPYFLIWKKSTNNVARLVETPGLKPHLSQHFWPADKNFLSLRRLYYTMTVVYFDVQYNYLCLITWEVL